MTPPREGGARAHLAWLMWCYEQGYTAAEDRATGLGNWLLDDPATLTPEDVVTRDRLLAMADEVLALLAVEAAMIVDP